MNAIIRRELAGMLRTWKGLGLQIAVLLCLGALVVLRWPTSAQVDLGGTASRQVFRMFGYGLMAGLMLISPAFPATSIVRERIGGTLALLLNSPIPPVSLVLGKLAGSLGFVLLIIVLSFPAAAACFAMGGISLAGQLGALYLVLALLALQCASIGLFVSSIVRSTEASLRTTYAAVLLLAIGSLAPHELLRGAAWAGQSAIDIAAYIRSLSPAPAVMRILGDLDIASAGGQGNGNVVHQFCIQAAAISVLCIIATVVRLSSRPMDRARDSGRMTDDRSQLARAARRVMFLWFFDPQRRSSLIAPWQNPVMVKEQRCRPMGRANWMMRLIGVYFVLSLLIVLGATTMSQRQGVAAVLAVIAMLQISLIVLLAPSLASGLISGERESKGWQLLQMTPLAPLTIIVGKLLSAAMPLAIIMLATLPAYVVLLMLDPAQLSTAISVQVTLILFAIMAVLLAAGVGSLFRNTAAATATAYTLLASLCVGTMFIWLGRDAPFSTRVVEAAIIANPLAATLNIIGVPGFDGFTLIPGNWYAIGTIAAICGTLLWLQVARLGRPR